MRKVLLLLSITALTWLAIGTRAQDPNPPPNSMLQPFSTREEVETFLRTAKIVGSKGTPRGITNPDKLTLDDGRVQHDAIFKRIDERHLAQAQRSDRPDLPEDGPGER